MCMLNRCWVDSGLPFGGSAFGKYCTKTNDFGTESTGALGPRLGPGFEALGPVSGPCV